MGHIVFVATTQLSSCSEKALLDNRQINRCGNVRIKLYLQKQMGVRFGPRATLCQLLL